MGLGRDPLRGSSGGRWEFRAGVPFCCNALDLRTKVWRSYCSWTGVDVRFVGRR